MQSEAARKIYGVLGGAYGKIDKAETERASRKPDRDLTDYDYYLRARGYLPADTHESFARARQIAEEGLARFPNSPALNLTMAQAFFQEQTDLGPFADCHEKFALAWKYANEADKTKSKSRRLEFFHHMVMAKLYTLYGGFRSERSGGRSGHRDGAERGQYPFRASALVFLCGKA
jgi:hypothetical protein